MRRLDINFNLIDDDNNFLKRSFSNCYDLDFFSIIYISNYNAYSGIFNSNCISGIYIRIFMLSDRICKSQNEKDENAISISTSPETTILETTLPIPETTIPHIMTTMPEVEITNSPINEQQIATNSFKVESSVTDTTTIQNIKTTEQQIATNSLKIESSVIDTATIQNIKTTVLDMDKIEKTEDNISE